MLDQIIPINFAGGCGGSFLNAWLTTAKYNYKTDLEFTDFGSMHTQKYLEIPSHNTGIYDNFEDKINRLKECNLLPSIYSQTFPPYFTTIHSDLTKLKYIFKKFINITYTNHDLYEISACYLIKTKSDINFYTINNYKQVITSRKSDFANINDNNICSISWNEIQHQKDIELLILKLSNFTDISISNFNRKSLITWRNYNIENINTVNNILYRTR